MRILIFFTLILLSASLLLSQVPQSCNIELHPENKFIGVVNNNYHFTCGYWRADENVIVQWYLNSTIYDNGSINNVYYVESSFGTASILLVDDALPVLNNTVFTCLVVYSSGINCNSSSMLLLQGRLQSVTDLEANFSLPCSSNGTIEISWCSPFTLDLSIIQDDVLYEVSIAYGSLQEYKGNITKNMYTTTLPDIDPLNGSCDLYNITVTSFNPAGIGESAAIITTPLREETITVDVIEGHYFAKRNISYTLHTIPGVCEVKISMKDRNHNEFEVGDKNIQVMNICNNESVITMSTINTDIEDNHHYFTTLKFPNTNGFIAKVVISTFDAQNLLIDAEQSILSLVYLTNTTASGALLVFCVLNNKPPTIIPIDIANSENYIIPTSLSSCDVRVFDIEDSGVLSLGKNYPAISLEKIPSLHSYYNNNNTAFITTKILFCSQLNTNKMIVKLSCSCDEMESLIGYQAFLLHNMDPSYTIYANMSNCSEEVTLVGDTDGLYHVVIFAIEESIGITEAIMFYAGNVTIDTNSTTARDANVVVIVSVVAVTSLLLLIYFIIPSFIFCWYKCKSKANKITLSKGTDEAKQEAEMMKKDCSEERKAAKSPSSSPVHTKDSGYWSPRISIPTSYD